MIKPTEIRVKIPRKNIVLLLKAFSASIFHGREKDKYFIKITITMEKTVCTNCGHDNTLYSAGQPVKCCEKQNSKTKEYFLNQLQIYKDDKQLFLKQLYLSLPLPEPEARKQAELIYKLNVKALTDWIFTTFY